MKESMQFDAVVVAVRMNGKKKKNEKNFELTIRVARKSLLSTPSANKFNIIERLLFYLMR